MTGLLCRRGFCLLLVLTAGLLAAEQYRTYTNARFGFSVDYPVFLQPQPEPENRDGRVFISRDCKVTLTAFASHNVENRTLAALYQEHLQSLRQMEITPSYKQLAETFFVVSWRDGSNTCYLRCAADRGHTGNGTPPAATATAYIEYDDYHQRRMDPIVTRISRSLRGPQVQGEG